MYSNINYDLIIKIKDYSYNGLIKITFTNEKIINKILLDSVGINITKIKINNKNIKSYKINKKNIIINYSFINSKYEIIIHFNNKIINNMIGLYYSNIKNEIVYCTDFEPENARLTYPCFDNPHYRATFQLILFYDKKYIALSNTEEKYTYIKNNVKITIFEKTPLMSTYLLSFVIGNFHKISNKESLINMPINMPINMSVYCHKSINIDYMIYSFEKFVKGFDFYSKYYKIKYPINKLDMVCIPEFESAAMENWGLIIFNSNFFYVDNNTSFDHKLSIDDTIYHELVHQWFGNLVCVKNWNNLWLNESFATYMSNYVNDDYQYSILKSYSAAIYLDSFNSSYPIYNELQKNKKKMFNGITYSKGACILRYIEKYLGEKIFKNVINKYLKKYAYSSTDTQDFINMLPIKDYILNPQILMKNLIMTRGYPIIKISKNNKKYKIEIRLFNILENNFNKLQHFDYDIIIDIKLKNNNKQYVINSLKSLIIDDEILLVNIDNVLLCTVLYDNYKPDIENMNDIEKLGYLCNLNILLLYNGELFEFINILLNNYLNFYIITKIFKILSEFKIICNIKKIKVLKYFEKSKLIIEKILINYEYDIEILNILIDILVDIFDMDINIYKNIYPKKYIYKINIKNKNYNELLNLYINSDIIGEKKYISKILTQCNELYDVIIKTIINNKYDVIKLQDIPNFIELLLNNYPNYIKTFLLFLQDNTKYYLLHNIDHIIVKFIYSVENSKLLSPDIYKENKDIIEHNILLYNYI